MIAVVVVKAQRTNHQLYKQLYCRWRAFYHASPDGMTGDYPACTLWRDQTLPAACNATFGWLTCPPAFVPLHTGLWVMDDCVGSCQHCHPGHHTPRTLCVCTRAHTLVCVCVCPSSLRSIDSPRHVPIRSNCYQQWLSATQRQTFHCACNLLSKNVPLN